MDSRIPTHIQELLTQYTCMLVSEFGKRLYGVYIYGSLALSSYNDKVSDIDFMTVIKNELSGEDIRKLQAIHKKLIGINPLAEKLEGEYINYEDVGKHKPMKQYPYFALGKFQGMVSINYAPWFQLTRHGIAICGDEFSLIAGKTEWADVSAELLNRLENYWPGLINWRLLISDQRLAMVVLTACRIFYSIRNREVIAKRGAREYALQMMPEEWRPLVREALRIELNDSEKSLFRSRFERLKRTREFAEYVLGECKLYAVDEYKAMHLRERTV